MVEKARWGGWTAFALVLVLAGGWEPERLGSLPAASWSWLFSTVVPHEQSSADNLLTQDGFFLAASDRAAFDRLPVKAAQPGSFCDTRNAGVARFAERPFAARQPRGERQTTVFSSRLYAAEPPAAAPVRQPEVMPQLGPIPDGQVLITIAEGFPAAERWLNEGESFPAETMRWQTHAFLLPRIPLRYDDWGIRAAWKAPLLLRMAADVELPPGSHRLLLRARALGRLWVDGQLVARTEPILKQPPNGEEPITPLTEPPLPGLRVAGYHQQEVISLFPLPGSSDSPAPDPEKENASNEAPSAATSRPVRVVLELIVGGKNLRSETGEVCVARQTADGKSYELLRPRVAEGQSPLSVLPLTDAAMEPVLATMRAELSRMDDQNRRQAAASQDLFWERRHAAARAWMAAQPPVNIPAATVIQAVPEARAEPLAEPAQHAEPAMAHPIDRFIAQKIVATRQAAAAVDDKLTAQFQTEVLPLLREHCFRCHGDKATGGLKLDSQEAAFQGGESMLPAVVPGRPESSELLARVRSDDASLRMPPTDVRLTDEQIGELERWIAAGAVWPGPPVPAESLQLAPLIADAAFVRRIYLDLLGLPPTAAEVEAFLQSTEPRKREKLVDQLLQDERHADHAMSFWLDILAENPTLLNASLNSTGPFRWFLYDALRDRRAVDRWVTELIMMRGGAHEGGSAGFAIAAENDAPLAAKGHILATAFLGIELQCARCHDSPYHSTKQRDLYALSAMLGRKTTTVPKTSRVPAAFFEAKARESLIRVTLKPDEPVPGEWPFVEETGIVNDQRLDPLMQDPSDSRERLAVLITGPGNQRFPRVMVNYLWKRLMGAGLVEPAHDWEGRQPSHPELLDWLASEFVMHNYDWQHVVRWIVTSAAYQREPWGQNFRAEAAVRFFQAPDRRRLSAEQIVDALHVATDSPMEVEELTFVHDGRRPVSNRLSLERPRRAWMFASLNNERDRPSLSLPRAQTVVDVLEAFGWTGSRQKPITDRESEANLLQPAVLANGTLTLRLTRAANASRVAQWGVEARSPEELVDFLFLQILNRKPTADERESLSSALADGFHERLVPPDQVIEPVPQPPLPLVTWFNHLRPDANQIQQEWERRIRLGPPADPRLQKAWREGYEDLVWSLINHREFVWLP
jgi:hypothetical protein